MSKSKGATAPAVPAYTPVVRRSYKPRPDGHDPFFDLPFVSHSKRDGYVSEMNAWDVRATDDYSGACRLEHEFAANFAQYLKDNVGPESRAAGDVEDVSIADAAPRTGARTYRTSGARPLVESPIKRRAPAEIVTPSETQACRFHDKF